MPALLLLAAALSTLSLSTDADTAPSPIPALGRTDPNSGLFPDSSLVDFRFLLDGPAGKKGFLRVSPAGKFVWPDGRRARFWGVNISRKSVFVDRPTIDKVVDVLSRAGTNMVRFEALDSSPGLLDIEGSDSSRALNPDRMAQLDYWTAKLRERGIYYYFDLLDFRQFKAGDEVPNYDRIGRAARPYAFFDRRLIDLQKEFAEQLLTHTNPLTRLRYVDDPALALVEICNEHGLFFRAGSLDSLVEPYGAAFRQDWNGWLLRKYGSRDALKKAWGRVYETDVLSDFEKPTEYSVSLPSFAPLPDLSGPGVVDTRRAPARLRDGVQYLYDVQRTYFREMKTHLRQIGLKVPITGVVSNEIVPDVASVAAELDFTSENYYADHPAFVDKDWEGLFYYNDSNPLRSSSTYQLAPWLSGLRWNSKPVVVREWATVWPNRYRAIAIPEMSAYAAMQDFDAVLLFGYTIAGEPGRLSDFDHQADPLVWGLFALGAKTFLQGHIAPAPFSATLQHTPDTLYRWPNTLIGVHRLSWFVRLNSVVANDLPAPLSLPAAQPTKFASRGKTRSAQARPKPDASVWPGTVTPLPEIVAYFQSAGAPADPKTTDFGALRAGNAQITRDQANGRLYVSSPQTVAICGELPVGRSITVGPFSLVTPTPIGAVMAVSLDGKPLAQSRYFVVKMVSRAENSGQALSVAKKGAPAKYHLEAWGKPPVKTFGRSEGVTILRRGKKTLMSLALTDGTWELLVRDGRATLACDTPAIRGSLLEQPIVTSSTPTTVANGRRPVRSASLGRPVRTAAARP